MKDCIWGGSNVAPGTWVYLLLVQLALENKSTKKQALVKPATLAQASIWLKDKGIDTDISTLSRMKRILDCHARISERMKEIRSTIINYVTLETCNLHFERNLYSSLMFAIPKGDLAGHSYRAEALDGTYEAIRYSLRNKKKVICSAFQFYRNEKGSEALSGYSNVDDGTYRKDPVSGVHRYRELRRINPPEDVPYFIHVRGFVILVNNGFYLIGIGMETTSDKITSQLKLRDIRRAQIENEFLEDDGNPAIVRGVKAGFLRSPAHPLSTVIHLDRKEQGNTINWDQVSSIIQIGNLKEVDGEVMKKLEAVKYLSEGILEVQTI